MLLLEAIDETGGVETGAKSKEVEDDLSELINENLHNLYVRLALLGLLSKGI
jgi:hypothetical protein